MMKHRKKVIGLCTVIFAVLLSFCFVTNVNAAQNKPSNCTDADQLSNYYDIEYKWSSDYQYLVFTAAHGEFRITSINKPALIHNTLAKDSDGFYTVDGGKGILKNGSSLKLKVKGSVGDTIKLSFAMSKDDSTTKCDSLPNYKEKKKNNKTTYTYESGTISIEIPNFAAANNEHLEDNSANYNGICKALRNGTDPTGKISAAALALYDGSTAAQNFYKGLVPNCYKTRTVFVYDTDTLAAMIRSALNAWEITNSANIGQTDGTDIWSIKFNDVMAKAKNESHAYYVTNYKKELEAAKFWKLVEVKDSNGHVRHDSNGNILYKKGGTNPIVDSSTGAFGMKCSFTANNASEFASKLSLYKTDAACKEDDKNFNCYNIDANQKHYYGYNRVAGYVQYIWNYTRGNSLPDSAKKQDKKKVCERICEEAVEVKYGPPVASKAGLCFEYQIQVTSRIRCTSNIIANPPEEPRICNPVPICNSIPGYIHQAGGNEEYTSCINSCDGGKYTNECSEKCYNKVYKNNKSTKSTKSNTKATNPNAEKLGISCSGKYYWDNGSIRWDTAGTYARYYCDEEYGRTERDHGRYVPSGGFKKHVLSDGSLCKDPCRYTQCGQKRYLNKSEAAADTAANVKLYDQAIAKCKASSSCTTKTANFTINISYKSEVDNTIRTIEYPYVSQKPQELKTSGNNESTVCEHNGSAGNDKVILRYGGCYEKCGKGLEYHSRWSFPGTYLNKKTGELSFKPKTDGGWTTEKDKFCMPLTAKDVNTKWWNYYYTFYDSTHTTSYDSSATATSKCGKPDTHSITDSDIEKWNIEEKLVDKPGTGSVSKWNINGHARNFGFFGWNFDISCFYALNSSGVNHTEATNNTSSSSVKDICENKPATSFAIRSVDLEHLFPDTNGSATSSREPGFNWSENANISAEFGKNPNYTSFPSAYAKSVQATGYNVYSDDYLDYQFKLTREVLDKLKSQGRDYSDFKGRMITKNGVYTYVSDLYRDGGKITPIHAVNEIVLGCNNVANYGATNCESGS